jgi:putative nucleotidyltransferase with HDIG domain
VTTNAKLYVSTFLMLGVCVLAMAFAEWRLENPFRFAAYFLLALTASILKVAMPGMAGRMPFNFLFVLVGLIELSLPETLLIGCTAVMIECVWQPVAPTSLLEAYFSVANIAVAIAVASQLIALLAAFTTLTDLALLLVGTAAFFIFNTFPVAAVKALTARTHVWDVWKATQYPAWGWYLAGAVLAWSFHWISEKVGWQMALMGLPAVYLLYRTYRLYVARVEDARIHAEQLASIHMRTIESLALAIEAKDTTTSDHLKRVQVYAVALGKELGMNEDDIEALRAAAILHDIGKLAVPEYIISKPGKLTPEEFEKMKVHPVVGAEILQHVQFPYPVVPIVRAHHERWNGTGYPYGLRGKEIPLGARILAAVDSLDALASDRQYRRALPLDEAMARVVEESGRSFDPDVVTALQCRYLELEQQAQAVKGSGLKLSTDLKVGAGVEPGAGYESVTPMQYSVDASGPSGMHEIIAKARHDIQVLFESGSTAETLQLEEICSVFALRLRRMVPFEAIAIYVRSGEALAPVYVYGQDHKLFSSLRIPIGQGLSGWVLENNKPIVNGNPTVESGYLNNPAAFSTLRAALSVPLEGNSGTFGVVSLYRDARDSFTQADLRVMQGLGPRLSLAFEQAVAREQCEEPVDSTGSLLNGSEILRLLDDELSRCKRMSLPLGVLVCSVEPQSGKVNMQALLRCVMGGLEQDLREFDALARTGDAEFVLVKPGLTRPALEAQAARLTKHTLTGGAWVAVGVAGYPEDGDAAEKLLAAGDRDLYRSRTDRRDAPPLDARLGAWVQ